MTSSIRRIIEKNACKYFTSKTLSIYTGKVTYWHGYPNEHHILRGAEGSIMYDFYCALRNLRKKYSNIFP